MYYFITEEGNYYQATEDVPMNETDVPVSERPTPAYDWNYESSSWIFDSTAAIELIREERDQKLKDTDKYMLIDFPITEPKRDEWKVYRQSLRDLPATVDPEHPVWPVPPS